MVPLRRVKGTTKRRRVHESHEGSPKATELLHRKVTITIVAVRQTLTDGAHLIEGGAGMEKEDQWPPTMTYRLRPHQILTTDMADPMPTCTMIHMDVGMTIGDPSPPTQDTAMPVPHHVTLVPHHVTLDPHLPIATEVKDIGVLPPLITTPAIAPSLPQESDLMGLPHLCEEDEDLTHLHIPPLAQFPESTSGGPALLSTTEMLEVDGPQKCDHHHHSETKLWR